MLPKMNQLIVHQMYQGIWDAISTAAEAFEPSFPQFESTFAPVAPQPDETWLQILLDFVTLGVAAVAAPIFNSCESPILLSVLN